jgi:hypothetical protein
MYEHADPGRIRRRKLEDDKRREMFRQLQGGSIDGPAQNKTEQGSHATSEEANFAFQVGQKQQPGKTTTTQKTDTKQTAKVEVPKGTPKVSGHNFRTSGSYSADDKCVSVVSGGLAHLGVDGGGTAGFHHPEELVFNLDANGGNLADFTFEIHRTKVGVTAERHTGSPNWVNGNHVASSPDGPPSTDSQLIPNSKGQIYSMDAPGIRISTLKALPANVVGFLQLGNFEEHVEMVNRKTGARFIDPTVVKWHVKLIVLRSSITTSGWMLDTTKGANEIGEGHQTLPQ